MPDNILHFHVITDNPVAKPGSYKEVTITFFLAFHCSFLSHLTGFMIFNSSLLEITLSIQLVLHTFDLTRKCPY